MPKESSMSKMEEIENLEDYAFSIGYIDSPTIKSGPAQASPVEPIAPVAGDVWFNTTDNSMYVYGPTTGVKGLDWIQIGGSFK